MPCTIAALAVAAVAIAGRWFWLAGANQDAPVDATVFGQSVLVIMGVALTLGVLLDIRIKFLQLDRARHQKQGTVMASPSSLKLPAGR